VVSRTEEELTATALPMPTGWLLSSVMEARGKQDLWVRQKPAVLKALREQAIIQSAESSNRIEGVTVAPARLRPVVVGKVRPRDRSEEELAGYRKALDWIFTRKRPLEIMPEIILHLHRTAQGGVSGDAGRFKERDNEIVEILANGERRVRFRPTTARDTPSAVTRLCRGYESARENPQIPVLLGVATTVFDFLCIHPFRDGNGRVSRLLTTLLLEQNGFVVGIYISLERLIEEGKEAYYRVLEECSRGWHERKNEIVPWWNYFLSTLRRAYTEFAEKMESAGPVSPGKAELVLQAIRSQVGPFMLADLRQQCPGVSVQLIKKVLLRLKREKKVRLQGRGRSAHWTRL
jgi:Fic family protein